ncbi:MAG: M48 family metalloprotease [Cyclobacteriaceae bacterium]|nr:M48 family metalloprotease [Cyclobacteriaceae bacterium HetDA_MAG_MS6]
MKKIKLFGLMMAVLALSLSVSCGDDPILLFSVQNDIDLGEQVAAEIASDPTTYPVLSEAAYPAAYNYLKNMRDQILGSSAVRYKDEFAWKLHIIQNDEVLNAFATPGGYIYIYTGLIKFLDTEDDLAGVLAHEIAHSDRRHSSQQLQRQYGISLLLSLLTGGSESELTQIAGQVAGTLSGLSFSRGLESEADEFSVIYLSETNYACDGAASFFEKLEAGNQGASAPAFLSTHPPSADRVTEINTKANSLSCSTSPTTPSTYEDFKTSLP